MELIVLSLGGSVCAVLSHLFELVSQRYARQGPLLHRYTPNFEGKLNRRPNQEQWHLVRLPARNAR